MTKALCKILIIIVGMLLIGNRETLHAQQIKDSSYEGKIADIVRNDSMMDIADVPNGEEEEAAAVDTANAGYLHPGADLRSVDEKKLAELKEDKYLNYIDLKKQQSGKPSWWQLTLGAIIIYITLHIIIFRWLIIGVIAAILLYILYRYMKKHGLGFFRSMPVVGEIQASQEVVLHTAGDYEKKILQATEEGNFKETIRWWYLYSLFQLSEINLIKPSIEKTNKDYLRSLRNTPYYRQFSILTMEYEYVWYGSFEIPRNDFEQMEQQFQDFKHQISKRA
ncbi:MAG: hypothetical protein JO154_14720 [Chitinophaga sp.]|uniref:hypothetical protein n=1 Tax=Chitinophaga sp. TaxID=1869181 RepID=UPI0025C1CD98|nr:hypothetical protein [Chitinophaga sp.]MBV8253854.1 hypothetical protein [Chitinophaga sp.]